MPAVKKAEAESVIRYLLPKWRTEAGLDQTDPLELHFTQFWQWMKDNHYPYTQFRSTMGAAEDAEVWFDQAFGLMWTR